MANRTQKAAMKAKAEAEKAKREKARAKEEKALEAEAARAMAVLDAEARKDRKASAKAQARADKAAKAQAARQSKSTKTKPAKGQAKTVKGETATAVKDETPANPGLLARWRTAREERAVVRKAEAERRAKARQAEAERRAKEMAEAAAKARQEAEERRAAEEAAAALAEKERRKQEKRAAAQEAKRQAEMAEALKEAEANARRQERREEAKAARALAKEEAARLEAEKAALAEAKKEERRRQRQAEREAIEERERRAAEEAEAADRAREAAKAARKAAAAAAKDEPQELEPEMEFQEGSKPVDPARALVPSKKGGKPAAATPEDLQADKMAEELARRRSKPVVIVEDEEPAAPRLPDLKAVASKKVGAKHEEDEGAGPLVTGEAVVDEKYQPDAPALPPPSGLSIPEMLILVANPGTWDERAEKPKPGYLGGALAGAILLELLQRGRLLVQRDRFTIVGETGDDEAVEAAASKARSIRERKGDIATLPHQRRLAKWNRELLEPFKDRLAERGLIQHSHRMHLGVFYRSQVTLLDQDAQERLQNKLRRAIAGGGTPEAGSILLLGLLDACGLLASIVPDEAMDYNRKRLNGLLGGRDIMGYKVDPHLKALQEVAVRTILQNVRAMT